MVLVLMMLVISLLIEKSDEFLLSQSIFKPKRQDQRKSAAVTGSRPPIEQLGNCQDQLKNTEGPTDLVLSSVMAI
jgi:hypothetical protein